MKIVEIIRLENSHSNGMFGVMKIDKELFCFTLEPPNLLNKPNVSCIPCGQYICSRTDSSFGKTFIVENVPNRKDILFHYGNTIKDTEGCIILGSKLGNLSLRKAVMESRNIFYDFINKMENEEKFHLTVLEKF